jgi:tripartite-type tricarboxylate transporter receptor subunit TctC
MGGKAANRACAAALSACALTGAAQPGAAQDAVANFYRGKQVTILVGFSAGGSSSLYSQALSRVMGRHLPGNPTFVMQHMPGAGGLTVVNHVYANAARDGSVFATTGRTSALEPLLGNPSARFDANKLNWLGTANVEYTVCFSWFTAKVRTLEDLKKQELVVSGTGANATDVVFPKSINAATGTRFKIVQGYPGSTEMILAMERGETEGVCGIGWTFMKLRKGEWLRDRKVNLLFQIAVEKHPEIPQVPLIIDHARSPEDRRAMELIIAPQKMGRPFFAPPGVPADRLKALRVAFERSLKDPAYLSEASKMGIEVQHVGGEEIQDLVKRIYATPKEIVERAKAAAK